MRRQEATRQFKRATLVALAATAAIPAAAEARVVETVTVTGQASVPAGQTRSLTLKCPARAVALNGAAPSATSSIPGNNARGWTFRFARSGSAVLRCVRLRLPAGVDGVGLAVGTIIEPVYEVPPDNSQNIDIQCPAGQLPTGWGLERLGADNTLSLAKAVATRRGWSFTVKNAGSAGSAGTLHIRCLERKQRAATGQRHRFDTRIASFTEQVAGGDTASRSCRAGEYSVSTGISFPPADDIVLSGTGVTGERGGQWTFAQRSGAAAVRTSIVCLARTTGFHR